MVILMSESHRLYILSPLRLIMANQKKKPTDILSEEEQYFVCRAINLYGSEHHPFAIPEMLDSFYENYIIKVINDTPEEDLTDEGLIILQQIKEKMDGE
jgi:hypothetical protein